MYWICAIPVRRTFILDAKQINQTSNLRNKTMRSRFSSLGEGIFRDVFYLLEECVAWSALLRLGLGLGLGCVEYLRGGYSEYYLRGGYRCCIPNSLYCRTKFYN